MINDKNNFWLTEKSNLTENYGTISATKENPNWKKNDKNRNYENRFWPRRHYASL